MTPCSYRVAVERVRTDGGYAWSVQAILTDPDGVELRRVEAVRRPDRAAAEAYAAEVIARRDARIAATGVTP